MSRDHRFDGLRDTIDRRLDAALDPPATANLSTAREAVDTGTDRWYGLLLALSHGSVAGRSGSEEPVSAAAAVELLRGYVRVRGESLGDSTESVDTTDSLLAGDYLYATAYATLGTVDHPRLRDCFEAVVGASNAVVEGLDATRASSDRSVADGRSHVERTAGRLGECAAVVGVTLAGAEGSLRESFATVGRGLGAHYRIQRSLAAGVSAPTPPSPDADPRRLRDCAERHLDDANRALSELGPAVDVQSLRALAASDCRE